MSEVGRNDDCPCGSGKKYKRCCMGKPGAPGAAAATAARRPAVGVKSLYKRAVADFRAGRLASAGMVYRDILQRKPNDPVALAGLAEVQGGLGKLGEAIGLLRRAVAAPGHAASCHLQLSSFLTRAGEFEEALSSARRFVVREPKSADGHYVVASALERMHQVDEAIAAARTALSIAPTHSAATVILARLQRRGGDLEEARDRLRQAIARESGPVQLSPLLHELGFVLDKLGDYDGAFEAFERAGAEDLKTPIAKRTRHTAHATLIAENARVYTRETLAGRTRATFDDDYPPPAFLVGFPRSGTTMTEQILASHPDIVTAEEKPLVAAMLRELARVVPGPEPEAERIARATPAQIAQLRAAFWRAVEEVTGAPPGERLFVDKNPLNIVAIGMINVVFPEARVLVALRDPRDVCLSCLMQTFQINDAMVHFTSVAETAAFYDLVMGFWLDLRERLSLRFIEVRYEDTVVDLEGQARRILDLFDVAWNDDVLRFHERAQQHYSNTPSFAAVSEQVNTKAVGRWERYARHLAPVLPRLQRYVEAFGYDE